MWNWQIFVYWFLKRRKSFVYLMVVRKLCIWKTAIKELRQETGFWETIGKSLEFVMFWWESPKNVQNIFDALFWKSLDGIYLLLFFYRCNVSFFYYNNFIALSLILLYFLLFICFCYDEVFLDFTCFANHGLYGAIKISLK